MGSQPEEVQGDVMRDHAVVRPEDITSVEFPVAMRGYDRDAVKRALWRVASDYKALMRQRDHSMAAAADATTRAAAAETEVQASARDIAALTKANSELKRDLETAQAWIAELEESAASAASAPAQDAVPAVDERELRRALERITELESEVHRVEEARRRAEAAAAEAVTEVSRLSAEASRLSAEAHAEPAEPAPDRNVDELLGAAVRAADALRTAARDEAQRTLKKARQRSAELAHEMERQARALAAASNEAARLRASADRATAELKRAQKAKAEAEREAERVKAAVQAEVKQTAAALDAQRERVQTVLGNALTEALSALEISGGDTTGLLDDLSARLAPSAVDGPADAGPPPADDA